MMRSLFSAVSGLKTHQTKMDVIGNNVSNVNTVAFKSSQTTFNEIMYQTMSNPSAANAQTGRGGVNAKQIGLGVSMASTKITIASSGAAETTGDGLDLRLTDKVSPNFFIVSNGTQNLFTRAGSFYIDGAGNLAMTSTGYTVMGWQVDETTGDIRKDTVSALRVMQAKNLTSPPESTTLATVAGTMDKNDTNAMSDEGHAMALNFYDKLGYSYTAKFAVKVQDPETETYTVELTDILDSEQVSVLNKYLNDDGTLSAIFGRDTTKVKSYLPTNENIRYITSAPSEGELYGAGGNTVLDGNNAWTSGYYYMRSSYNENGEPIRLYVPVDKTDPVIDANGNVTSEGTFTIQEHDYYAQDPKDVKPGDPAVQPVHVNEGDPISWMEFFGISRVQSNRYLAAPAADQARPYGTINADTGEFEYVEDTVNYTLKFSAEDGTFSYVGSQGSNTVMLNLSETLGNNFSDIEIDFSGCEAADNGGKTTLGANAGYQNEGVGKALGAMIGLNINNDGRIYGSYDNGNTVLLGQIAIAQFANASGLEKVGENCYTTTLNSGDFDGIGKEISADGSSMNSGELEMSNVDLSTEFTQMIITQRGFQSNSRVITTSDTLLEELINLKR